jgi:hypothetical protein
MKRHWSEPVKIRGTHYSFLLELTLSRLKTGRVSIIIVYSC